MADQDMKITDKRMFTPEGELREEYRHLEDAPAAPVDEARPAAASGRPESPAPAAEAGAAGASRPEPARPQPPREAPPRATRAIGFEDLVGMLAEQAMVALGVAVVPDAEPMLDLRVAQMYIDMLDVLRVKTAGNLAEGEAAFLEDILYRLRLAYVEKRRVAG
ncbi:MAG: DUF1844 domain-containing protein [Acidobacteriota bacterium]|nr:DUF1844 domain-containing protein [Acidobacteriota bacterium]MDH3524544.1 DUF1844 domain-containing protein [Acidobacteriota bacterium]